MFQKNWSILTFSFLWLILVVIAILTRPALPVDETRYLAVAWEMWQRGDFIVPYLNGETYSHKPPLLFWIMNLGWAIFGVNEWWPPLVAPLFALACLFLTRKIAQKLWPDLPQIADLAPLILLGAAFWTIFTTVTMFDMLVAACTLWGLLGLLSVWRDGNKWGWLHLALAIGVGVLAKGPVILLQVLPVALLLPLWDVEKRITSRRRWYLNILLSVLGGAVMALAWAIPAGIMGGEDYRNAIFWGQTAGRVVKSFAHARPWWWYLAVIGPLLLPWVIWPTVWKATISQAKNLLPDPAIRFCILWFVPIFIAFSLISGKQLHYLLPIFPAFSFVIAYILVGRTDLGPISKIGRILPTVWIMVLSIAVMVLPYLNIQKLPVWAQNLDRYWMILAFILALITLIWRFKSTCGVITSLSVMMVGFVIAIHLTLAPYLAQRFDLHDMGRAIKSLQDQGNEIAFMGKYHGTFQFLGRLNKPIAELATDRGFNMNEWIAKHPKAKIITVWKQTPPNHPAVVFSQQFRRSYFIVFDLEKLGPDDMGLIQRRGKN